MTVVEVRSRVSELDPIEPATFDSRTVMYWSQSAKQCLGSQRGKARKLLDYDCIKYAGLNEFVVLPLNTEEKVMFAGQTWTKKPYPKSYNKKEKPYILTKATGEEWNCNCQWAVKMHKMCSHVLALKLAFKMRRFNQ